MGALNPSPRGRIQKGPERCYMKRMLNEDLSMLRYFAIALLALLPTLASAGEDIAGAKDHPLLTRYPESFITAYKQGPDFVTFKVATGDGKTETTPVKGQTTVITYELSDKTVTPGRVLAQFEYQAVKQRMDLVYYRPLAIFENDGGEKTFTLTTNGKTIWIKVEQQWSLSADKNGYQLTIVEASDEQPFGPKRRKGMP